MRLLFSSFLLLFVTFTGQAEDIKLNARENFHSHVENEPKNLQFPSVSAQHAILLEQTSSRILFEKNANKKTSIASLTKVMTAIVAIESGELSDKVKASDRAIHTSGSSIYLQKNEKMPLEDLLYGLMLRSGNDAAVAIAEHVGGSVEGFVFLMNEKAAYLGLNDTHFANPHGLEEKEHYSTAYDVAKLMQYAMENEIFQKITNASSFHSENRSYQWNNKNKLLNMFAKYCNGGKTGFTKLAGRTLVTSSNNDGFQLIAVTLNAPDDWNDHMTLYNWGYDHYVPRKILSQGTNKFEINNDQSFKGKIKEDIILPLHNKELDHIKRSISFKNNHNTEVEMTFFLRDKPIKTINIEIIQEKKPTFSNQFFSILKRLIKVNDHD